VKPITKGNDAIKSIGGSRQLLSDLRGIFAENARAHAWRTAMSDASGTATDAPGPEATF